LKSNHHQHITCQNYDYYSLFLFYVRDTPNYFPESLAVDFAKWSPVDMAHPCSE
jgi:hypothetical protein